MRLPHSQYIKGNREGLPVRCGKAAAPNGQRATARDCPNDCPNDCPYVAAKYRITPTIIKMNNKPKYNPQIHHRRSIRLKGYDYSQAGLYFITICCDRRGNPSRLPFGNIENGKMVLNEYGQIAYNEWEKLQQRFTHVDLDVFQIMPNHIHAIIALTPVGATLAVAHDTAVALDITKNDMNAVRAVRAVRVRAGASPAPTVQNDMDMGVRVTVSDIVGAYKSLVANGCLEIYKIKNETMGQLWQRNYYEHIIRNEQAYQTISEYIINNPEKWAADKFYTR